MAEASTEAFAKSATAAQEEKYPSVDFLVQERSAGPGLKLWVKNSSEGLKPYTVITIPRVPELLRQVDAVAEACFKRTLTATLQTGVCVKCGGAPRAFADFASAVDFTMAGYCQSCQDSAYKGDSWIKQVLDPNQLMMVADPGPVTDENKKKWISIYELLSHVRRPGQVKLLPQSEFTEVIANAEDGGSLKNAFLRDGATPAET